MISDRFYIVSTMADVEALNYNFINSKNVLVIVPGMIDDSDSDEIYTQLARYALSLEEAKDWVVILMRNRSHGYVSDTLESAVGKFFGWLSVKVFDDPPEYPARVLSYFLDRRCNMKQTAILCHSQGGIITTNALLAATTYTREDIKLAFFGAAAWLMPPDVASENVIVIVNRFDPVSFFFGRGLLPSTIKYRNSASHGIPYYIPVMTLGVRFLLGSLTKAQLASEVKRA